MEPMAEQIAALQREISELAARQGRTERHLRHWRGLAGVLLVAVICFQPLRGERTAAGSDLVHTARLSQLQPYPLYRPPRVRRTTPSTSSTAYRLATLEQAVNYEEQQIQSLGAALNQEIAARQAGDARFQPLPEVSRAAPFTAVAAGSPFTDAQTITLRKLAGLVVVSGGVVRCNGDLALTSGHALLANRIGPVDADARMDERGTLELSGTTRCYGDLFLTSEHRLLANRIAPVDPQGRLDEHGTTEFGGNVSVAKRLVSAATARTSLSPP